MAIALLPAVIAHPAVDTLDTTVYHLSTVAGFATAIYPALPVPASHAIINPT